MRDQNAQWLDARLKSSAGPPVLVADDSEVDIFFLLRALSASGVKNPVHVVRSGAEAIEFLSHAGRFADPAASPRPGIVFLDLMMPEVGGLDVLRWKQHRSELHGILWVALSNFDSVQTINQAYQAGANTFLSKPLDPEDIRNLVQAFEAYWSNINGVPNRVRTPKK